MPVADSHFTIIAQNLSLLENHRDIFQRILVSPSARFSIVWGSKILSTNNSRIVSLSISAPSHLFLTLGVRLHQCSWPQCTYIYLPTLRTYTLLPSAHITYTGYFQISIHASDAGYRGHRLTPAESSPKYFVRNEAPPHPQPQHVFNQIHSLLLGPRSFSLHSPEPHDHGHATTIR